jgi:hypothetical protein
MGIKFLAETGSGFARPQSDRALPCFRPVALSKQAGRGRNRAASGMVRLERSAGGEGSNLVRGAGKSPVGGAGSEFKKLRCRNALVCVDNCG